MLSIKRQCYSRYRTRIIPANNRTWSNFSKNLLSAYDQLVSSTKNAIHIEKLKKATIVTKISSSEIKSSFLFKRLKANLRRPGFPLIINVGWIAST